MMILSYKPIHSLFVAIGKSYLKQSQRNIFVKNREAKQNLKNDSVHGTK